MRNQISDDNDREDHKVIVLILVSIVNGKP